MAKRGMVILVGATGTGKSTSLAALTGYRNRHGSGHIVTIEDPIEFVHEHDGCIITQRDVGVDTESFAIALKNTLRQAPDVILIGEIRTRETMEYAIVFAETLGFASLPQPKADPEMPIDDYVAEIPEARRDRVMSVIDLILSLYPGTRASMRYRMPTFETGSGWVSVADQKHDISLYTCAEAHIAGFKAKHPEIKTGKGCINCSSCFFALFVASRSFQGFPMTASYSLIMQEARARRSQIIFRSSYSRMPSAPAARSLGTSSRTARASTMVSTASHWRS